MLYIRYLSLKIMDNSLTTLLSTIVGGGIAILTQYIIEYRKSKNDKYRFSLEKLTTDR